MKHQAYRIATARAAELLHLLERESIRPVRDLTYMSSEPLQAAISQRISDQTLRGVDYPQPSRNYSNLARGESSQLCGSVQLMQARLRYGDSAFESPVDVNTYGGHCNEIK